jgi:putative ATPase
MQLRNAVTGLMRQFGYGQGYRYAHEERGHVARGMRYLPEELGAPQYYVPGELGFEARAVARWRELRDGEPTNPSERERA